MKNAIKKPVVVQHTDEDKAIAPKIIAQSIVDISNAMKAMLSTPLSKEAIITLVHARSRVSKKDIQTVINNLYDLEKDWLKHK